MTDLAEAFRQRIDAVRYPITFLGGFKALRGEYGVDVPDPSAGWEEVDAKDDAGNVWHCLNEGGWVLAYRERNSEEMQCFIAECNSRARLMVSHEQHDAAMAIARHLRRTKSDSRSSRRDLRRAVSGLAQLQYELLVYARLDMESVRARLAGFGIEFPRRDYLAG